jgi:ubiquinone/menaquinone biosynthesis C-methylase UbiE
MNENVFNEQKVWGADGNEDFFSQFRSEPKDLYRSEKFFLPDVLQQVKTCLDVGCACGGFFNIMRSFNPKLHYTGIDITPKFIEVARQKYKDAEFNVCDATAMSFNNNTFELVHCSGILHLTSHYQQIIREMYRVSSKYCLFDLRLTSKKDVVGEMDVNLMGQDSVREVLPYYVLNVENAIGFLRALDPSPASIIVKGYEHPPTKLARINADKIIMAFFLVRKGPPPDGKTQIEMDLNA